jgi:hypothetical protein
MLHTYAKYYWFAALGLNKHSPQNKYLQDKKNIWLPPLVVKYLSASAPHNHYT